MERYEWNFAIIGFDTYADETGLFQCELLLSPKWWHVWKKKQTVFIVGDKNGFYDVDSGMRVPKELNDNVIDWFMSWHSKWLQEGAVL